MTSPPSFAAAVVTVAALALALCATAEPARAKTDLTACYGETLDVAFRVSSNGSYDGTRVVFRLPFPEIWYVNFDKTLKVPNDFGSLSDFPCLPEPLSVREVLADGGGLNDPRTQKSPYSPRLAAETRLWSLWITAAGVESMSKSLDGLIRFALEGGKQLPGGFVRRYEGEPDLTSGLWLLPENYKTPDGRRVAVGCAWTCQVKYFLTSTITSEPVSLIQPLLTYEFDTGALKNGISGPQDFLPDRWIEQDRIVRQMVKGWMVGDN